MAKDSSSVGRKSCLQRSVGGDRYGSRTVSGPFGDGRPALGDHGALQYTRFALDDEARDRYEIVLFSTGGKVHGKEDVRALTPAHAVVTDRAQVEPPVQHHGDEDEFHVRQSHSPRRHSALRDRRSVSTPASPYFQR